MKKFLFSFLFLFPFLIFAQADKHPANSYQQEFTNAYNQYPDVPKGLLEAVSYTMTRFHHIQNPIGSCVGLPKTYGVMGLTLDGQNYFRNNLNYISQLSGIAINDILQNPQQNIMAFAAAYHHELSLLSPFKNKGQNFAQILKKLSELPDNGLQQNFALNSHLYAVLSFLNDAEMQQAYNFPNPNLDLVKVFGDENLKVLQSSRVMINNKSIIGDNGQVYKSSSYNNKSVDYPPALWDPADPSNLSSRNGTAISAVTIHDVEGSYAGCISWFKNPSANVSAHYVFRSSDGQVTQMVLEADKAWHVGSENPYTIGFEHEGYAAQTGWYTAAMYQSSANLVRDITQSGYGINPIRVAYFPWAPTTHYNISGIPGSCVTIKGHQHYPNQTHTDPGANWDWDYFFKLINDSTSTTITNTNLSGNITDLGGSGGNYTNDERTLFLIQPTNAASITLTVNQFDVESTWDYLYIYDGTTVFDTKIGEYTGTTIPTTITINSGNVLVEFRSDCSTTNPGYDISWSSTIPDMIAPTTIISPSPVPYAINDFICNFTDTDNIGGSGVMHQFYQVADFDNAEWRANDNNGFFNDDFDLVIHPDWIDSSGIWSIAGGKLNQSDESNSNTNLYASFNQNNSNKFLYHYKATISGVGANKRAGFHYMSDDASLPNRGNSYFVWFRQDNAKLQFYKVVNDTFSLVKDVAYNFNSGQEYDYKIVYDKTTGITEIYVDDVFVDFWQDLTPLTVGNYISLRSGNCIYGVDDLRVYHSRTSSESILLGSAAVNDIRYENNPTTSGKIRSIAIDTAYNISTIAVEMVDVDFITAINNDLYSNSFKIYPNPTKNYITIKLDRPQTGKLFIRDVTGKKVKVVSLNLTNKISISLKKLARGVYFLCFNSKVIKVVKE
jgi:hypothetical protein